MLMRMLVVALVTLTAFGEVGRQESHGRGYGWLSTADPQDLRYLQTGDVVAVLQDADAGCAAVVRVLGDFPTLAVGRTDKIVRDYRTGDTAPGCRVEMKGSAVAFRESGEPDLALRRQFAESGWTEDYDYAADGPDGSAFAFRNGRVLCVFRAHWDGGDDSDPTYVPEDRYDLEVDCLLKG